jgi:phospholipid/cholesterol/gamma-HCH transport system ATP-binding protein
VIANGTPQEVLQLKHPFIEQFFLGERGQRAVEVLKEHHGE